MDPINYSIDVQTPFQAALQGYQAGAAIRNDQQQQQQQQAALVQQQALRAAQQQAFTNPTADNFSRLMALDPKSAEAYQRAWNTRNTQQQQSLSSDLLQWGAAIKSGRPEVAAAALNERADLLESQNGGQPTPESQATRMQARMATENPQFALGQIQALLAANPNGKDAAETLAKFGAERRAEAEAPSDLAKKVADAAKAGIDAKYAEQTAVQDLVKKGWDIKQIQEDIGFKKEANRIALMNAGLARESNELKREELRLQIQKARSDLDTKIRERVADTEASAASIDNSLNTIERIKTNKSLDSVLGSVQGRVGAYVDDDASDAIALIDTLGSQAFLSQAANLKGMGALSNAEGEKLQAALTNLSRTQSEKQFRANLDEASRLLKKGRETLSKRSGVPLGKPDTPAAPGERPPLSSFNKSAGGASGDF